MVKMERAQIETIYKNLVKEVQIDPTPYHIEEDITKKKRGTVNPLFLHLMKGATYLSPHSESLFWNRNLLEDAYIEVTDEVAEKLHQLAGPYKLVVFKVLNEQLLENLSNGHRNGDQSVNDR